MIKNNRFYGLIVGIMGLLLCWCGGCTKEKGGVCLSEGVVKIALEMNTITEESRPPKMKFYFFPERGTPLMREVLSEEGFSGTLPEGKYRVLVFNDDDKAVGFRGLESFATAEAYALPADGSRAQTQLIQQPSGVYGGSLTALTVLASTPTQRSISPQSYVKTLTLHFKMSGAIDLVTSCTASINGIAEGINLYTREIVVGDAGGYMVLTEDISATDYHTTISVFGQVPAVSNILCVEIEFASEARQVVEIDITEALKNINDPTVPEVVIEPQIDVKKDTEGNFSATLISWSYKEESIVLKP